MSQLITSTARLDALGLIGDAYHKAMHDYIILNVNRIIAKYSSKSLDVQFLSESKDNSSERAEIQEYFQKILSQGEYLSILKEVAVAEKDCLARLDRTKKLLFDVLNSLSMPDQKHDQSDPQNSNAVVHVDEKMLRALTKQFNDLTTFACESILQHLGNIVIVRPCVSVAFNFT